MSSNSRIPSFSRESIRSIKSRTQMPYILDLAPAGLLSILKFDMGAYSRGAYSRGVGLLKRFILYIGAYSKPCVSLHAIINLG